LCVRDWHGFGPNDLLELFGMEAGAAYFYDPDNAIADEPLWFTATDISDHPIAKGVSKLYLMGARPLRGAGDAVVKSGPNSWTAHRWGDERIDGPQAVIRAIEYGKGRVVAVGSDYLFRPTDMDQADNRKLFANIIDWLAGGEPGAAPEAPGQAEAGPAPAVDTSRYDVLETVPPAQAGEATAKLWTFESDDGEDFQFGGVVSGFAYTGDRCLRAQVVTDRSYDSLIETVWNSDGYCTIPPNAHLNLAYYSKYPAEMVLVVEGTEEAAKYRTEFQAERWTWVSVPLSEFENGEAVGGKGLANIMIKGGQPRMNMEIFVDDLSITEGPMESPRP